MSEAEIAKPLFGAPCNGCGLCCMAGPCIIAETTLGVTEGRCPALEYEHGRYWCGMIRNAHKHLPGMAEKPWIDGAFRDLLMDTGAWRGQCDSQLESEIA